MASQALYRRYRPQRFGEVKGQDHVVAALRNAVRDDNVSHFYLFSGPRGTGKTSTARILAKALNCTDLHEGEPCGTCESCLAVEAGTSMAVTELDAASNNGVEAVRELIQRASLGTSGRTKVYIVDEVHMLSNAASNALLKTLEDPPAHVVFVLATTDPHKVLRTISSRAQHLDFHLFPAALLGQHLRSVAADAGLDVSDLAIDRAVRKGDGSARDALSALDQIVASGGEGDDAAPVDEVVEGLCERDTARALGGVAMACRTGSDPRAVASAVAAHLRDALLSLLAPDLVSVPDAERERIADQARRLGAPSLVRALDAVGDAVLALPSAPDPRVTLEVALVKVTRPEVDVSPGALLDRVEALERAGREAVTDAVDAAVDSAVTPPAGPRVAPPTEGSSTVGSSTEGSAREDARTHQDRARAALGTDRPAEAPAASGGPVKPPSDQPPSPRPPAPATSELGSSGGDTAASDARSSDASRSAADPRAKPALGAVRADVGRPAAPLGGGAQAEQEDPGGAGPVGGGPVGGDAGAGWGTPSAADARVAAGDGAPTGLPGHDALATAWDDGSLKVRLSPVTRSRLSGGRFVEVAGDAAVFALPSDIMRRKCEERRPELEAALAEHFDTPVPVRLVTDSAPEAASATAADGAPPDGDDDIDVRDLVDAPGDDRSGIDRLAEAFPGSTVVDDA